VSPKKPYQKRLPTVLPPAPRRPPAQETVRPRPAPPRARRSPPVAPPPDTAPEAAPADTRPQAPVVAPAPEPAAAAAPVAPPAPPPKTAFPPPADSPTDPAPARPGPPRRRTIALVAAALVGVLAGGAVAWQVVGPGEPSRAPASLPIDGWPIAGESRAVTEVLPGGDLEVTHWIHTERPLDELGLSLPDADGAAVSVTDVEVTADGRPASGPEIVAGSGTTYTFADATRVQVRYRMSGAVQLSSSADGRGLATTTSLDVTATQARDVRVVRSEEVLSLACAEPDEQPVPCGESSGDDQWRVELDGTDAGSRVLAVVTVPS
jgi:hypothetical protein